MAMRTIWYVVGDLTNPVAEPYAVLSVDTSIRRGGGVEGTVVSLHWQREEAERIVHEFNNGPLNSPEAEAAKRAFFEHKKKCPEPVPDDKLSPLQRRMQSGGA
jgi:hypothetical protein